MAAWSGLRQDATGRAAAWGLEVSSGQSQHGGPLEADTWLLPGTVTWLVGGQARMLTTLPGGGSGPALDPGGLPRKGLMAQRKWPRPLWTPEHQEEGSKTKRPGHTGAAGDASRESSRIYAGRPQTRRPQSDTRGDTGGSPRCVAHMRGSTERALGCAQGSWALGGTDVPECPSLLHTSLLHPVT